MASEAALAVSPGTSELGGGGGAAEAPGQESAGERGARWRARGLNILEGTSIYRNAGPRLRTRGRARGDCALVWGRVSGCELAYARGQRTALELGLPAPGGWTRCPEGESFSGKGVALRGVVRGRGEPGGIWGIPEMPGYWGPMLRADYSGFRFSAL